MKKSLFRKARPFLIIGMGALFTLILAACGSDSPAAFGPHTITDTFGPIASSERTLFYITIGIATLVFVVVEAALIFSIIRFRARPGMANPVQSHGNIRIEVLWTVIPALILFIVLGFTIQGLFQVSAAPAQKPLTVRAIGHQWWWEFYYEDYHITTADTLVAPVGVPVKVDLYSNNVIHSFWIPALTGKTDDIPGHQNYKYFTADKTGTYYGECAEFCGIQHAHMAFTAVIETSDQFNTWISTQQQAAVVPAAGSLAAQGQAVFKGQCTTCHGIVGVDLNGYVDPAVACDSPTNANNDVCKIGPNLTHFGSRSLIAGGVLINNKDQCTDPTNLSNCNLAKWLSDPQGVKPGNDMNIGALSQTQIQQLVAYLESLQ